MNKAKQQQIIKLILAKIAKVKLIYLFGSQANGEATTTSDIDIAILGNEKLDPVDRWNIQSELADELNEEVDLVDLLRASTVFQNQVITHGVCLFQKDHALDKFTMQVMSMYQHLNKERETIMSQFYKSSEIYDNE